MLTEKNSLSRIFITGLIGTLAVNIILAIVFSSRLAELVLESAYETYIESNFPPSSIIGIALLSFVHAWLFNRFKPQLPGQNWLTKGLAWGVAIWVLILIHEQYFLFQEWTVYDSFLDMGVLITSFTNTTMLVASLIEGTIISFFLAR